MYFILALLILGIFGVISGAVASSRNHSFWLFFVLGALISPVLAIILAFVIASPAPPQRAVRRVVRRGARSTGTRSIARGKQGSRTTAPAAPVHTTRAYRR